MQIYLSRREVANSSAPRATQTACDDYIPLVASVGASYLVVLMWVVTATGTVHCRQEEQKLSCRKLEAVTVMLYVPVDGTWSGS